MTEAANEEAPAMLQAPMPVVVDEGFITKQELTLDQQAQMFEQQMAAQRQNFEENQRLSRRMLQLARVGLNTSQGSLAHEAEGKADA